MWVLLRIHDFRGANNASNYAASLRDLIIGRTVPFGVVLRQRS